MSEKDYICFWKEIVRFVYVFSEFNGSPFNQFVHVVFNWSLVRNGV